MDPTSHGVRRRCWADERDDAPAGLPHQLQIQVDWSASDRLPVMAANIVLVQQTPHEFILTFGTAMLPVSPTPLTAEQVSKMKIIAQPTVRIALAPGRLAELLQALQQQLSSYQSSQRQ